MIENILIIVILLVILFIIIYINKKQHLTNTNKVIRINGWFGRLGNNIFQVINFLHLAIELNCNLVIPHQEFFNKQNIQINKNSINEKDIVLFTDDGTFFMDTVYIQKQFSNIPGIFDRNKEKVLGIMKDLFILKYKDLPNCNDNDLYIHIRSGDIFLNEGCPFYTQPPLDFYVKIIESNTFDKIYIIAEDDLNPCINKLLQMYPQITWNKTSLIEDIKIIMKCKNFIYGTKSLFTSHLLIFNEGLIKSWTQESYNLEEYYELIAKAVNMTYNKELFNMWKNTPEQLKIMVEYKLYNNIIQNFTNLDNVVRINNWYGRLGNNIKQIVNGLHIMTEYNCNFIIVPKHDMFDFNKLPNNMNKLITNIETNTNLFEINEIIEKYNYIDKSIFDNNKAEVLEILRNLFKIKYKDVRKYNDNDLHIHIRSGDIFISPHSWYMQPPLDYYIKIIESRKFDKIYLLAEDNLNPTIDKLLKLYPNIIWNKNNLEEDIKSIIGCKNVVFGMGYFIPSLLFFNEGLREIFMPSRHYYNFGYIDNVKEHIIDLTDYYKTLGHAIGLKDIPWEGVMANTPEQLKIMIEYKIKQDIY